LHDCETTGRAPLSSDLNYSFKLLNLSIKCNCEHPLIHEVLVVVFVFVWRRYRQNCRRIEQKKFQHGRHQPHQLISQAEQILSFRFKFLYVIFHLLLRVNTYSNASKQYHYRPKGKSSPLSESNTGLIQQRNAHFSLIIRILLVIGGIEVNPGPFSSLKCITINCRGLSDKHKFLKTIAKAKKFTKKYAHAIICLQETHHIDESY